MGDLLQLIEKHCRYCGAETANVPRKVHQRDAHVMCQRWSPESSTISSRRLR
jgi:hypothetical protein